MTVCSLSGTDALVCSRSPNGAEAADLPPVRAIAPGKAASLSQFSAQAR
jgi:hypothetical protein